MIESEIYSKIKENFLKDAVSLYVGSLLERACKKFGYKTALITDDKTISYKEFYFRSVQMSKKLQQQGIKPQDKVLLYFENSIEFYVAYFAIWQVGAVAVPINIFLHEKELAYIIKDCGAVFAIISDTLKDKWQADLPLFSQRDFDWQEPVPEGIEEIFNSFDPVQRDTNELCLLLYTSGTTGMPKGVMLSSHNIITNLMQCHARLQMFGQRDDDIFFSVLPLFHVFAQNVCLWLPVMVGASVIIVKKIDRKLILEGLRKKPTIFFGFPALYGLLCLLKTAPLDSIRIFVSGADAMPDKIRSAFAAIYGRKICAGYGLTEAAPVVGLNQHNHGLRTDVIGKPVMDLQCEIRDEQGNALENGQIGTLWIKGGNVMMGYYNAPEQTKKVLQDGWLNTGDFACFDKAGNLAIRGRNKDLIIHKGFNIYPQEVENVLMSHSAVFKAAVIGKEESSSGQIPIAFVALKSQDADIKKSLRKLCADHLAAYKIPRKFVCLDDLPMNATGKVDKKRLFQEL